MKLLVSIHIYGEAALYIQNLASVQSNDSIIMAANDSFRAEPNSVQDIAPDFESDISLLNTHTPMHTSELRKGR